MGFIELILSAPIPSLVAICMALVLAAGYWFYVFPLMEEAKVLRESNKALLVEQKQILEQMNFSLNAIKGVVTQPCTDMVRLEKGLDEIKQIGGHDMEKSMERLHRVMSDISDKQSQITGILMGITMHHGKELGPGGL